MGKLLEGKNIVLGVTGGIAVYKACLVVRGLKKLGANVDVIMTKNATEFVTPLTFETLSARPVTTDMFARPEQWEVGHISLAKKADLFLVCPATANIVGKLANGIADDMLSTTLMATNAPIVICPAMNTGMYNSVAFTENLAKLVNRGVKVVEADSGYLACGDEGKGRLAEPNEIVRFCVELLTKARDLVGKRILVTCGATLEKLDDARFISNFSSGKMGTAIATAAMKRGAEVTIVLARHTARIPAGAQVVDVTTTQQMYDEVVSRIDDFDAFIFAGAPCDYKPQQFSESKIKTDNLTVSFVKNPDIAAEVGRRKGDKLVCVFSAETDHCIENAQAKLKKKNADLCVLNDVKTNDVFGSDTNVVTLITRDGCNEYPQMPKAEVADLILDKLICK